MALIAVMNTEKRTVFEQQNYHVKIKELNTCVTLMDFSIRLFFINGVKINDAYLLAQ